VAINMQVGEQGHAPINHLRSRRTLSSLPT
jgi:hypothetical protein